MKKVAVISTKGGVGKTTTAVNLAAIAADAGKRVLLLDLDIQPTLSSYFHLEAEANGGIFQLVGFNETRQHRNHLQNHHTSTCTSSSQTMTKAS